METPSSPRRVTRSQTLAALANSATSNTNIPRKMEDSEKGTSKTKQITWKQDRFALIDITNDSPIVGLASGNTETPISSISKQSSNRCKRTPGSGEALLRGQVNTLLQKVEEEAVISKFCLEHANLSLHNNPNAFINCSAGLLAPTPANTPQVDLSSLVEEFESLSSVSQLPIEDKLNVSQVVSGTFDGKKQAESASEFEKGLISRSLFLDFSEKSDSSECSSVLTDQETGGVETESQGKQPSEGDDASIWSILVNTSIRDEEEDEDKVIEDNIEAHDGDVYDDEGYGDEGEEEEEGDWPHLDELCEEIRQINVNEERKGATKFMGKHTRFVYNSDDELVEEHEESAADVLRLRGLPTPKGKHLRFQDEEGDQLRNWMV